jgi:hypothetical protein
MGLSGVDLMTKRRWSMAETRRMEGRGFEMAASASRINSSGPGGSFWGFDAGVIDLFAGFQSRCGRAVCRG